MAMNKFFRIPFALSGDKNTVPDASQPSGSVSYTDGFGPDYELDPGVDPAAKDVPRDETNQLYFDITNAIKEYQEFGVPDFISSALNGGVPFSYSRFARVKWTDGRVYESRINSNTTDPTNATNWRPLTDNIDYLTIATTAFESSVSDGEAVYWDAPNNRFDEAIANGTSAQNVIGFADVTNGRVFVAGLYAGQLSGLTPNVPYFLSTTTPGAITTAGGSVRMGIARTSTSFFVSIGVASAALATETVPGIVELATNAEAQAFEANKIIDGAKLAAALQGANQSLVTNGYQRLPGGLIIQWGRDTTSRNEGAYTVTLPIAFPNGQLFTTIGIFNASNSGLMEYTAQVNSLASLSQIAFFIQQGAGASGASGGIVWVSIGH